MVLHKLPKLSAYRHHNNSDFEVTVQLRTKERKSCILVPPSLDIANKSLRSWFSLHKQEDTQEESDQRIEQLVGEIKEKFRAMNDGETSPSAYDTAWVARVPSVDGGADKPHFPMCVDWILRNQIEDGSWGEPSFYLLYDRLVNTLACVLALETWKIGQDQIEKGKDYYPCKHLNLTYTKWTTNLVNILENDYSRGLII